MEAHRSEATVDGDGSVTVRDLPLPAGETVEVIVLVPGSVPGSAPGAATPRREFGAARGVLTVPDDFDDPLDDFEPYT